MDVLWAMLLELALACICLAFVGALEWWSVHRSKQRRKRLEREHGETDEIHRLVGNWNTARHEAEDPETAKSEYCE
jgi:hypothetical protein